ncbi:MAG: tetratricopeptide repeat protein [Candidatus Dormibacteraeota bacterium]|nr:tetratricopeptide repeat protein [Candidatus Dormibacteraeota bacterium]
MVSLLGPAGTGKTRLALKAAEDLREHYPGGTWFIDLAPLRDPALLVQAVMAALGLREESTRAPLETLQMSLRARPMLLLLDNCEHLVDATARLVERLLATCPELKVLATSREALNIDGELTFPLAPLSLDIADGSMRSVELAHSEAAQLFIDRARSARPGFAPGERALAAIGALCRRLDGLPLAIELAAARVAVMSPTEVLSRLEDQFTFLSGGGRRTALARHQTLRAAIDWSYQLLDERDRTLFHRLSVFSGNFGLESVEAVCSGDPLQPGEIVELLRRLVAKSLVMVREEREQVRYVMLETLRDFARERLVASGEAGPVRRSHLEHYLALAASSARDEGGPTEAEWIERLDRDYDNLIAGLDWARRNDFEACLRLCGGLTWFWLVRGRFSEGRQRIADALVDGTEPTATRAEALRCVGRLALPQRDYPAAIAATESSLAISRQLNDWQEIGRCLNNLAVFAMHQEAFEEARRYYEESLAVFREIGNQRALAILLGNFGVLQTESGALEEGRRLLEESIAIHHNLHNGGPEAAFRAELAVNYLCRGDREAAQACALEGARLASVLGDQSTVALCLEALAWLAAERGQAETALRLAGAVRRLRRVVNVLPSRFSEKREARWLLPIRLRMPDRAQGLEREGELLAIDDAFALGEGVGGFANAPSGSESLSMSR